VAYPCATAWDAEGRLWTVGGPPSDLSISLHVGVAHAHGAWGGARTFGGPPAHARCRGGAQHRQCTRAHSVLQGSQGQGGCWCRAGKLRRAGRLLLLLLLLQRPATNPAAEWPGAVVYPDLCDLLHGQLGSPAW